MRVTIIGPGNMGRGIATRLLAGGHSVSFVGKTRAQAEEAASTLSSSEAEGRSIEVTDDPSTVIPASDLVILALPYEAALAEAERSAALLEGKILVDISNPLNESYSGLVTEGGPSGAEHIRDRLPASARVVKAFNTVFAPTLVAGDVAGRRLDVFIAGDDADANARVAELVRSSDMRPLVVGGLERARQLETLGFFGIVIQEPLGTGFRSGWKLIIPDDVADAGTDLPSGFPRESVVGAIDPEAVDAVLKDLAATGVAKERVQTFAGPEAEEALRNVTTGPTRALAFLFGFESEHTRRHLRELEGGHALMVVMVDDGEQAEGVGRVLARHGGHYINYYSRWTARTLVA